MKRNKRKKVRKSSESVSKIAARQLLGDEPSWESFEGDIVLATGKAFTWYRQTSKPKDRRKYIVDYLKLRKEKPDVLRAVKSLDVSAHDHVTSSLARMVTLGAPLCDNDMDCLERNLDSIIERAKFKSDEDDKKPVKTVKERVDDIVVELIGEIEIEIDKFLSRPHKTPDFDMYEWLRDKEVKPVYVSRITNHFKTYKKELEIVVDGSDDDIVTGYEFLNKNQRKRYLDFINSIIDGASTFGKNERKRKPRKRRARKTTSKAKQVAKVKYQDRDDDNKLVSINPTKIIGKTEVWLFNTRYNKLAVLRASDRVRGFTIKGTTVQGLDAETSLERIVRDTKGMSRASVLGKIRDGGKRVCKRVFNELTTKTAKATGRLGSNTIIIHTF
jgi:hypothetical protein